MIQTLLYKISRRSSYGNELLDIILTFNKLIKNNIESLI